MGLIEDIGAYKDTRFGMISVDPHPGTFGWDNPNLFTAQYVNLLRILGQEPTPEESVQFTDFVEKACMIWSRWPSRIAGDPSQDELIGWAILMPSAYLDHWVLPRVPLMEYRFIDLMPFLKVCAGRKLGIWGQICWALATIHSAFGPAEETSGRCLKFIQLRTMRQANYRICNWAIAIWKRKMMSVYPQGLMELFFVYFKPDHPFTRYAPQNFELGLWPTA